MSLVRVDTIKPITSGADLSLQGDSGGSAVDCLNITSAGDVDFTGNTDAKIKLPSAGGIYESDGTTAILTESGGTVTLDNVVLGSSVTSGKLLQVVQTVKLDTTSTTATSMEDMTGMTVDITPASASNKVYVLCDLNLANSVAGYFTLVQIVRAGAAIYIGDAAGSRARVSGGSKDSSSNAIWNVGSKYLDSPSSASAVTYKIQWRIESGSTGYLNRTGGDVNATHYPRTASSITVMEISA